MPRRRSESRSASPDDRRRSTKKRAAASRSPPARNGSNRREGSPHLSKFYRDRFGNQSPDSYNNLRISCFDHKLSSDEIKATLESEFSRYNKKFEVKMVRHNGDDDRFAYVNFEEGGPAKDIRRSKIPLLMKKLGNRVCLDPTGVIRDQEGKYIPDRYNRSLMDRRDRSPEPRRERERRSSPPPRRRSPPPSASSRGSRREKSRSPVYNLNKEELSRTLFVGNLYGDMTEKDLHEVFTDFGEIEDVEIKSNYAGEASYAFVVFMSIDAAEDAQKRLNDKSIRKGGDKKFKIGYAKAQISRRLWIGDLGTWCTRDMLEKEFDRFGPIEEIEYRDGDQYGYITYSEINAASDACKKRITLDRTHNISVDFAKVVKTSTSSSRKRHHSSSSPDDSKRRKPVASGPRTPPSESSRSSSPEEIRPKSANGSVSNGSKSENKVSTIDDLRDAHPGTWKGPINLKKVDYVINLHRVAGKESVLQDYLRDDDGRVLKLMINQRLPLDNSLFDKLTAMDLSELAVCIGVEHDKRLTGLISYLKEKDAAGVITMDKVVTYIMGYSSMTSRLITHFAPQINVFKPGGDCVLVVVKKL